MGSGMGLLDGSTLLHPDALVLDAELYHSVRVNAAELDTGPDQLALDVIHAVGPRGHYLRQRHTREAFHKMDFSDVLHVPDMDGSYREPLDMARQKTDWILENHHPEPLSDSQKAELTRILEAAENELS